MAITEPERFEIFAPEAFDFSNLEIREKRQPAAFGEATADKATRSRRARSATGAGYAAQMAKGGLTRAALARHLGVSRAWVTKALRALPHDKAAE